MVLSYIIQLFAHHNKAPLCSHKKVVFLNQSQPASLTICGTMMTRKLFYAKTVIYLLLLVMNGDHLLFTNVWIVGVEYKMRGLKITKFSRYLYIPLLCIYLIVPQLFITAIDPFTSHSYSFYLYKGDAQCKINKLG